MAETGGGAAPRRRIAVASGDTLSDRLAGPGIRALALARALAREHHVRLVTTARADLADPAVTVESTDDHGLAEVVDWCDVLVGQGWVLAGKRFLRRTPKVIVADLYDPMHLEQLEQAQDAGEEGWWQAVFATTAVLNDQLLRGDHFLCASARQRDFWLGQLAGLGRVNPATYADDPGLASLLSIVPFGIEDDPPRRSGPGLRGVVPGVGPGDKVVLWGGGIYNWLDPLTVIRAVDKVRHTVPTVRLVFMGARHPNAEIPAMRIAVEARRLADALGLVDRHVFFNEGWVPYAERQNVLLDADVGVSANLDHVEAEFAYRTRVLDYVWAGLPVVATGGDTLGDLVEQRGLGLTVLPGDVVALADALARLLTDARFHDACRARIDAVTPELRWSRVAEPLLSFCRAPRRAPDLLDGRHRRRLGRLQRLGPTSGPGRDLRRAAELVAAGDLAAIGRGLAARVRRRGGGEPPARPSDDNEI